jgi:uncharacterized protein YbaP (TraB family)
MKILFTRHYWSKRTLQALLLALAALVLTSTGAHAYQGVSGEIRYVDRSKGERNQAYQVIQPDFVPRSTTTGASAPLLWRIESPRPDKHVRSSYIFGTIHIDDQQVMDIPDSVTRRLSVANSLLLELELNDINSIDILRKMLFTDGKNLQQFLSQANYDRVTQALAETGNHLPADVLSLLKPWAAMLMLIRPENSSGTFLDKKLANLARQSGTPVLGLETIDEQLSVFDNIPIEDQITLLDSAIDRLPEKTESFQQLLQAYLSGDLDRIVAVSASQEPDDARLAKLVRSSLIDRRNQTMFDRMQPQLQEGNAFIAVGALHLPGEQGLLYKLEQAGYRLVRIGYRD